VRAPLCSLAASLFQIEESARECVLQCPTVRYFLGARERSLTLTNSKMKGAQESTRSNAQQRATVWEHGAQERGLTLTPSKMKGARPNSNPFQDEGSAA
jgi:hypothetical protein